MRWSAGNKLQKPNIGCGNKIGPADITEKAKATTLKKSVHKQQK